MKLDITSCQITRRIRRHPHNGALELGRMRYSCHGNIPNPSLAQISAGFLALRDEKILDEIGLDVAGRERVDTNIMRRPSRQSASIHPETKNRRRHTQWQAIWPTYSPQPWSTSCQHQSHPQERKHTALYPACFCGLTQILPLILPTSTIEPLVLPLLPPTTSLGSFPSIYLPPSLATNQLPSKFTSIIFLHRSNSYASALTLSTIPAAETRTSIRPKSAAIWAKVARTADSDVTSQA